MVLLLSLSKSEVRVKAFPKRADGYALLDGFPADRTVPEDVMVWLSSYFDQTGGVYFVGNVWTYVDRILRIVSGAVSAPVSVPLGRAAWTLLCPPPLAPFFVTL